MSDAEHYAIHEAGHSVLMAILGAPVSAGVVRVWLTHDGGWTHTHGESLLPERERLAMILGGFAAERRAFRPVPLSSVSTDLRDIDRLLAGRHHDQRHRDRLWFAGRDLASELIALHWRAVRRVSDALLIKGELSGREVAGLCGVGRKLLLTQLIEQQYGL